MATLPRTFLQSIRQRAQEHGVAVQPLADDRGLVLFAAGLSATRQAGLLKEMAAGLQHDAPAAPPAVMEGTALPPTGQMDIDCQVTVEERTQLFKFLNG
mgnify:CR=1 FL=1